MQTLATKIEKVLIKRGHNADNAAKLVADNIDIATKCFPEATPGKLAEFIVCTA